MAGRLKPTRDKDGYITDKALRQKIAGILGSAEAFDKPQDTPASGAKTGASGAKPANPRQRLEQQMKAE
jgi:hypothetical protein